MGKLYEQIYEWGNLMRAWHRVRTKKGAPGSDRVTVAQFEHDHITHLNQLQTMLKERTYRPDPLICFSVNKPNKPGETRTLSIPTVRDRIVQHATLSVITPGLEQRFTDFSYAYRPGRSIFTAVAKVQQLRDQGYSWVLHADIKRFFDSIDHELLKNRIGKYIFDKRILELLCCWAKAEILSKRQGKTYTRPQGIPQGSVVSPLLANLYLDHFDEAVAEPGHKLVRYADDLLVLGQEKPQVEAALEHIRQLLPEWKLQLNDSKTRILHFSEGFCFLGTTFTLNTVNLPDFGPKGKAKKNAQPQPPPAKSQTKPEKSKSPPITVMGTEPSKPPIIPTVVTVTPPPVVCPSPEQLPHLLGREQPLLRTLYIQQAGTRLSLSNQRFKLSKNSVVLLDVPCCKVDQIMVFGPCIFTPAVIQYCLQQHISVAFLNTWGRFQGELTSYASERVERQQLQFQRLADAPFTLAFSRQVIAGKLSNSKALLQHIQKLDQGIDMSRFIQRLQLLTTPLGEVQSQEELLGYEGAASAVYFAALRQSLPAHWGFTSRKRQPPPDPINALLSLGYTYLHHNLCSLLRLHHLNPEVGYLHHPRHGHAALASDLQEEFRAPVVDHTVWSLLHQNKLTHDDFTVDATGPTPSCQLRPSAFKVFTQALESRLRTTVRHAPTGLLVDFRRCIELQIQQLLNTLKQPQQLYQPYSPANW